MLEKRLPAVSPQSFIADGGTSGKITVSDTRLFKVKQKIFLRSNTQPSRDGLEVKQILNQTEMLIGPEKTAINSYSDVSAFLVADAAVIGANEQFRPSVPVEEIDRAVYEEEPTVAIRSMLVDKNGNDYRPDNPLPVELSNGSISIGTVNAELEVQLSHKDNFPDAGDIADSVRIGDGTNELAINADGSINVDADIEVDAGDGDNVGLKVQQRTLSPSDTLYNKRVTAVTGSGVNADTTSLDVSLHDQSGNPYTAANPLPISSAQIIKTLSQPLDFFGNTSVATRTNQIEVPLDDTNWTNFVDTINVSTGASSQANGQVTITTGTNANGRFAIVSKDFVRYRPNSEIGWGFTFNFPTASLSNVYLRIGATDDATTWNNSVYFGHENGTFSLIYRRNGSTIFSVAPAAWLDPCNGASSSNYVNFSGVPVALDITKDQLARIRAGLFGHAGFIVELLAPNQTWVKIYEYSNINTASVPVFGTFDLKIAAEVKKVAANSSVYTLSSACWAGWTGSSLTRVSEPITDRTLTQVTRTIIEGKSSSGGGIYVPVKVNPSGSLETSIGDIGGVAGQDTMANSLPVVIASDQSPVDVGVILGDQYAPTMPDTGTTQTRLMTDPDNQLKVRGDVLTDEGTYRDDFSGTALNADWTVTRTGGTSYAVSTSLLTLSSGTASGNAIAAVYPGDYSPISLRTVFSVSGRFANQTIHVGFIDQLNPHVVGAYFEFVGTSNTQINCVTRSSSDPSDVQITPVTYFNSLNSSQALEYYVEVQPDQVTFLIAGQQVAQHRLHLPGPYDSMDLHLEIENTAATSNANVVFDYIYIINQNSLQVNNSFDGDSLPIRQKTGFISTYATAISGFAYAANGTDIFTIQGSNSKVIRIKHLSIDGTQTSTNIRTINLIKRSSQNTGGTSVLLTPTPYDSSNPTATATVRYYTANPTTLGTSPGIFHTEKLIIPSVGGTVEDALVFSTIEATTMQDITLRSSNELLAVNMAGVSSAGNSMNIDVVWTEE